MDAGEINEAGQRWMSAMRRGDFAAAWDQTDLLEQERRDVETREGTFPVQDHHLMWNGRASSAKRVVVWCNHGLGDTIQFVRFLPALRELAAQVTIMAQPPLVALLQTNPAFGDVLNGWTSDPPPHDLALEVMELAYMLRVKSPEVGQSVPYLRRDRIMEAARDLPSHLLASSPRVGLIWAASDWDELRSLELRDLQPLAECRDVSFHSLQQGLPAAQAPAFPMSILSPFTEAPLEAAAAMLEMDLIITVDTFAAHLAGALGVPTWLLLRHRPDWRWQDEGTTSCWYPTMRLFRQQQPGGWKELVAEVARNLRAWTHPFAVR